MNEGLARKKQDKVLVQSTHMNCSEQQREMFSGSEDSQEFPLNDGVADVVEQPPALSNSEHAYSSFSKGDYSLFLLQSVMVSNDRFLFDSMFFEQTVQEQRP